MYPLSAVEAVASRAAGKDEVELMVWDRHPKRIAAMFGRIARRYDLMNTIMTGGRDESWRRFAVHLASPPRAGIGLDVGTGTGKLAFALARAMPDGKVIGVDISEPMVRRALAIKSRSARGNVWFQLADAMALPFKDASFDCVVTGFCVRNVPDVDRAFAEMARVARPGARVVCLEIVRPSAHWRGRLAMALFGAVVPPLGRLLAGDQLAYSYLPRSVSEFFGPDELAERLERAGLLDVEWHFVGMGLVGVFVGVSR